jgi:hypothetical protein
MDGASQAKLTDIVKSHSRFTRRYLLIPQKNESDQPSATFVKIWLMVGFEQGDESPCSFVSQKCGEGWSIVKLKVED